jgi:uncharacterized membrane protein YeaQ/YmgE (transglycosylase-associated protein family)
MDIGITLGVGGWILLVVGSIAFGVVANVFMSPERAYDWIGDASAAGIGAFVASELVPAWRAAQPSCDGLAVVPALLGGIAVGALVAAATRYLPDASYDRRPLRA